MEIDCLDLMAKWNKMIANDEFAKKLYNKALVSPRENEIEVFMDYFLEKGVTGQNDREKLMKIITDWLMVY